MRHGEKICQDSCEGRKKVVGKKKNTVNYNCRELLKHDSGAGERKERDLKGE